MTPKTLYTIVGAAWGLTLGFVVGASAAVLAYAISWMFIFGDNTWPEIAETAIAGVGVAAAVATFTVLLIAGYRHGSETTLADPSASAQAMGRAWRQLAIWLAVTAALLVIIGFRFAWIDESREQSAGQTAQHMELAASRHRITGLDFSGWQQDDATVTVHMEGARRGEYQLSWTVRDPNFDTLLEEGSRTVFLAPEEQRESVSLELSRLKEAYRDRVLHGAGGVLVDEWFRFNVVLTPLLTSDEQASLSSSDQKNLRLGESPLIVRNSVAIPVQFTL